LFRFETQFLDRSADHSQMYAQRAGNEVFRRYHDEMYERFWRRDLEIEDLAVVRDVLVKSGANGGEFEDLVRSGEGLRQCAQVVAEAEQRGVFGVPEAFGELLTHRDLFNFGRNCARTPQEFFKPPALLPGIHQLALSDDRLESSFPSKPHALAL